MEVIDNIIVLDYANHQNALSTPLQSRPYNLTYQT